jgi:hypothetical protein
MPILFLVPQPVAEEGGAPRVARVPDRAVESARLGQQHD